MTSAAIHPGGCLCGAVRFQVLETGLAPIQVCHCGQCRKAQGTPFVTNIPVERAAFTLSMGQDRLKAYESSPGKRRWFCNTCGSPVYSEKSSLPGVLRLRAGSFDGPLPVRPEAHFHVASACNWWAIEDDGLIRFP